MEEYPLPAINCCCLCTWTTVGPLEGGLIPRVFKWLHFPVGHPICPALGSIPTQVIDAWSRWWSSTGVVSISSFLQNGSRPFIINQLHGPYSFSLRRPEQRLFNEQQWIIYLHPTFYPLRQWKAEKSYLFFTFQTKCEPQLHGLIQCLRELGKLRHKKICLSNWKFPNLILL